MRFRPRFWFVGSSGRSTRTLKQVGSSAGPPAEFSTRQTRARPVYCMRVNLNYYPRKPNYPAFQITIIYAPTTRMHTTRPFPPQPYKWSPNGGFQSVLPGLRRRAGSRAHTNYRKRKVRHRPTHGCKKIAPTRAHENSPRT